MRYGPEASRARKKARIDHADGWGAFYNGPGTPAYLDELARLYRVETRMGRCLTSRGKRGAVYLTTRMARETARAHGGVAINTAGGLLGLDEWMATAPAPEAFPFWRVKRSRPGATDGRVAIVYDAIANEHRGPVGIYPVYGLPLPRLRCNQCYRMMKGTTPYDGACECCDMSGIENTISDNAGFFTPEQMQDQLQEWKRLRALVIAKGGTVNEEMPWSWPAELQS